MACRWHKAQKLAAKLGVPTKSPEKTRGQEGVLHVAAHAESGGHSVAPGHSDEVSTLNPMLPFAERGLYSHQGLTVPGHSPFPPTTACHKDDGSADSWQWNPVGVPHIGAETSTDAVLKSYSPKGGVQPDKHICPPPLRTSSRLILPRESIPLLCHLCCWR